MPLTKNYQVSPSLLKLRLAKFGDFEMQCSNQIQAMIIQCRDCCALSYNTHLLWQSFYRFIWLCQWCSKGLQENLWKLLQQYLLLQADSDARQQRKSNEGCQFISKWKIARYVIWQAETTKPWNSQSSTLWPGPKPGWLGRDVAGEPWGGT